MGGSSLAPGGDRPDPRRATLTVLDTTDPHQVRHGARRPAASRTVVVVSSKSGGTVETDSHRRAFRQAFLDAGSAEAEAGRRFVVVTDPGSPLEETAAEMGARAVFLADPDRRRPLQRADRVRAGPRRRWPASTSPSCSTRPRPLADDARPTSENPALALGAALGAAAVAGRDKLALAEDGTGIVGLGDWAEQLIAESTGKDGRGHPARRGREPGRAGLDGADVLLRHRRRRRCGSAPCPAAAPSPT